MAKKFFNTRVHNTKRTIINWVIIGVCVLGIIICFIVVSNFEGESHLKNEGSLEIKSEVEIEIYDEIKKEMFFSIIKDVDLDKVEVIYQDDIDNSKPGTYDIKIIVNNEEYHSKLMIKDMTQPTLKLKEVSIKKGESYKASDFVDSCVDNSKKECNLSFCNNCLSQDAEIIDYTKYKNNGIYEIKITATDVNGNEVTKSTILQIGSNNTEKPQTCKYGDATYDTSKYVLAVNYSTNNCAVNVSLFETNAFKQAEEMTPTEMSKIIADLNKVIKKGSPRISTALVVTQVKNNSDQGVVGYQIEFTHTITLDNKINVIRYRLDTDGKRVFSENPYNLPE